MNRKKYPLMYHLKEVRKRLLRIALLFFVFAVLGYMYAEVLLSILVRPLSHVGANHRLIFTELTEVFATYVRMGITTGMLVGLPLMFHELWGFLWPGLKKKERLQLRPIFLLSPLLFFGGIVFSYILVLPNAVSFFASFETTTLPLPLMMEARVADYVSLSIQIMFAFGIAFQLPIVLYITNILNILSVDHMRKFRRIAFVVILILSAILTPPDLLSMIMLAIPLYGLYEGTILFLHKRTTTKRGSYA